MPRDSCVCQFVAFVSACVALGVAGATRARRSERFQLAAVIAGLGLGAAVKGLVAGLL